MEEFPGIPFVVNGTPIDIDFRPSAKLENPPRCHEFWFYMRMVNVLGCLFWNKSGDPIAFGNVDNRFIESRFFGKSYHLIREQDEIDGFPDFAVVKDDLIITFDHFKIDSSKLLGAIGNSHGTEYLRLLGIRKKNKLAIDIDSMEEALAAEGLELTTRSLATNLIANFSEKATKLDGYKSAIRAHIKSGLNETFVAEDLAKPIETWLMVEEVSPKSGFEYIAGTVSALLEQYPSVRGLVYISNPIPTEMFSSPDQVMIISNDDRAIVDLRGLRRNSLSSRKR